MHSAPSLGGAAALALCLAAPPPAGTKPGPALASQTPASWDQADRVARGRYLATAICECFECHSPLEPGGREIPVASKLGAGDILDERQRHVAPNITPDMETGAGTDRYSAVRAIREGIGHDGRRLSQAMPYVYFSVLTDDDVHALVALLRSLPPVRNRLPKWIPADVDDRPAEALRPPAVPALLADQRNRGEYLVRLGRCVRCHSPRPATGSKRQRRLDMEFGGAGASLRRPCSTRSTPIPA